MYTSCITRFLAFYILFVFISITSCRSQSDGKHIRSADKDEASQILEGTPLAEYVVEVFEDSRGNMWFGTMARGLGMYDGKSLQYFGTDEGLPGTVVSSMVEDSVGNLWFGGHSGLCKFDPLAYDEGLNPFTIIRTTSGRHDEGSGWSSISIDKKGNLWESTSDGLYRYNGAVVEEFTLPIPISEIDTYAITAGKAWFELIDTDGNFWFSTDGYGAFKFDGKNFTHFSKEDGLCSNTVNSITQDDEGNLWFACMQAYQPEMTHDGGLCRYDRKAQLAGTKVFTKYPELAGLSNADLYCIYKDKAGDMWIAAPGTGLYQYDGSDFRLYSERNRTDLTEHFAVQSICEDSRGKMWLGMSGGLFMLNGSTIEHVSQEDLDTNK